jgi:hypothetical protein
MELPCGQSCKRESSFTDDGTLFLPIFMNNQILNYLKHNLNRFYFQSRFYVNFLLYCARCNAPLLTSGVSGALEIPLCICINPLGCPFLDIVQIVEQCEIVNKNANERVKPLKRFQLYV